MRSNKICRPEWAQGGLNGRSRANALLGMWRAASSALCVDVNVVSESLARACVVTGKNTQTTVFVNLGSLDATQGRRDRENPHCLLLLCSDFSAEAARCVCAWAQRNTSEQRCSSSNAMCRIASQEHVLNCVWAFQCQAGGPLLFPVYSAHFLFGECHVFTNKFPLRDE